MLLRNPWAAQVYDSMCQEDSQKNMENGPKLMYN